MALLLRHGADPTTFVLTFPTGCYVTYGKSDSILQESYLTINHYKLTIIEPSGHRRWRNCCGIFSYLQCDADFGDESIPYRWPDIDVHTTSVHGTPPSSRVDQTNIGLYEYWRCIYTMADRRHRGCYELEWVRRMNDVMLSRP
jgi:hypothetical protein